ncbi:hypothetical protein L596_015849 [Steinernema carpocapsae]|uniref:Uncharacterized protein n=1 Tax=Steinernema carpocapsae TaxID=34508 RepID=A0A4U5NH95_STECR|nr:hypothetical protein L596_015849 [Steinernema carpocapsae]
MYVDEIPEDFVFGKLQPSQDLVVIPFVLPLGLVVPCMCAVSYAFSTMIMNNFLRIYMICIKDPDIVPDSVGFYEGNFEKIEKTRLRMLRKYDDEDDTSKQSEGQGSKVEPKMSESDNMKIEPPELEEKTDLESRKEWHLRSDPNADPDKMLMTGESKSGEDRSSQKSKTDRSLAQKSLADKLKSFRKRLEEMKEKVDKEKSAKSARKKPSPALTPEKQKNHEKLKTLENNETQATVADEKSQPPEKKTVVDEKQKTGEHISEKAATEKPKKSRTEAEVEPGLDKPTHMASVEIIAVVKANPTTSPETVSNAQSDGAPSQNNVPPESPVPGMSMYIG